MTWDAFHHRGDVLRTVVDEANHRRDATLPTELPGVTEAFPDDFALVTALQMRWHTHLSGRIERALMHQPDDLEDAVVDAWRRAAAELVGVRVLLDAYAANPTTPELAEALARAIDKDRVLMAAMAGLVRTSDARAPRIGRALESRAREQFDPTAEPPGGETDEPDPPQQPVGGGHAGPHASLLRRIKAHLAA